MKKLSERIIEAGLVDKHTLRLFERWGAVMPGEIDTIERRELTKATISEFVDDIENLLEESSELKETRLEIVIKKPPQMYFCQGLGTFVAVEDELGRLIVGPNDILRRGDVVSPPQERGSRIVPPNRQVLEVEPLYQGDKLHAYQVTLESIE